MPAAFPLAFVVMQEVSSIEGMALKAAVER
jgi:hypothetical protein